MAVASGISIMSPSTDVPGLNERIVLATENYEWLKATHHVYADGGVLAPRRTCDVAAGGCGNSISFSSAFMVMDGKPTKLADCCIATSTAWISETERQHGCPAKDVLKASRSYEAGSIAWVATDEDDVMLAYGFGVLSAGPYGTVTNNMTELLAMIQIARRLPYGWTGIASTDSAITRGRFSAGWKLTGIPTDWFPLFRETLQRIDVAGSTWRLLQGHPLQSEIKRMKAGEKDVIGSKRGLPVSLHQDFCDELCASVLRSWSAGHFGAPLSTTV